MLAYKHMLFWSVCSIYMPSSYIKNAFAYKQAVTVYLNQSQLDRGVKSVAIKLGTFNG